MSKRAGFVALIGEPNAGKSTLLNRMVGAKVSIVTHKVQTTRARIRGVALEDVWLSSEEIITGLALGPALMPRIGQRCSSSESRRFAAVHFGVSVDRVRGFGGCGSSTGNAVGATTGSSGARIGIRLFVVVGDGGNGCCVVSGSCDGVISGTGCVSGDSIKLSVDGIV
jgi:hypothetical protein